MKTTTISLEEYVALLEIVPSTDPDKAIAGIWHSTIQHPEHGNVIAVQGSGNEVLLVHS